LVDVSGKSIALFVAAALAEIGGAYLVWTGLRDGKGPLETAQGLPAFDAAEDRCHLPSRSLSVRLLIFKS
jgi:YnfA/UPF0060 family uncharacterized protein